MAKSLPFTGKRKVNPVNGKQFSPSLSPIAVDQPFQNIFLNPTQARAADILVIQRTLGNRAVNALLNRSLPKQATTPKKITVNAASDGYEQEADRVAEQAVQMPTLQLKKPARTQLPLTQKMPEIQENVSGSFEVDEKFTQHLNSNKGQGETLPSQLKNDFEAKFGNNFSGVRIHTDAQADAMSCSIQAKAFTAGSDIFFRHGAYQPESLSGQRVIAHELAHVRQQSGLNASQTVIQRLYLNESQPLPLRIESLQARIKTYHNSRSIMEGFNHLTALQIQIQKLNPAEKQALLEFETEVKNERSILGKLQLNGTVIQTCLLRSIKDGYQEISKISNISSYIPVGDIQGSFALNLVMKLQALLPQLSNSLYQMAHLEGKTEQWAKTAYTSVLNKLEGEIIPAFAAVQMPIYLPAKPAVIQEKAEQLDEAPTTEPAAPIGKKDLTEKESSNEPNDLRDPIPITVASTGAIPSTGGNKPSSDPAMLAAEVTSEELSEDERSENEAATCQTGKLFGGGFTDDSKDNPLKQTDTSTPLVATPIMEDAIENAEVYDYKLPDDKLSSPSLNIFEGYNYAAEFSGEQPLPSLMDPLLYVSKLPLNSLGNTGAKPAQLASSSHEMKAATAHMPASKSALDKAKRYESRANDLLLTGGNDPASIEAMQMSRYKLSAVNAYFAAKYFQQAGDGKDATSWARKVLAIDPASTYAEQARRYLAIKQSGNQTAIETSGDLRRQRSVQQVNLKEQYVSAPAYEQTDELPTETGKVEALPKVTSTENNDLTEKHGHKTTKPDNSRSGFAPKTSSTENISPVAITSKRLDHPAFTPISEKRGNASKSSEFGRGIETGQGFMHPAFIDVNFFDQIESSNKPAVETKPATGSNKITVPQKSETSKEKTAPLNPAFPSNVKTGVASQEAAVNNPPPRALPSGSVTGNHGLTVSPAMITAIRQDIMTRGIDSKWADQHEIGVLASVLGVKIIVHDPNRPSNENGDGNDIYELYYNGKDHYDAKITDPESPQGFRKQRIPGDGDCFYNGIVTIASKCKNRNFSVIGLRRLVHDNLTDQDIADIALTLIEDFKRGQTNKSLLDGIGGRFRTLMRNRQQSGIIHYSDA